MDSASSLENTRRLKPSRLKLRTERASSDGKREEGDEDSADRTPATMPFAEDFFLAVTSRGSLVSKTGSASTASVLVGACRPAASRRMSASAEAEGRLTTSKFLINGW